MDKVLAFSILSASPADISAGAGIGGSWGARLSWRRGADDQHQQAAAAALTEKKDKEKHSSRPRDLDGRGHATGGGRPAAAAAAPRFAPEFDGIECFETIVAH